MADDAGHRARWRWLPVVVVTALLLGSVACEVARSGAAPRAVVADDLVSVESAADRSFAWAARPEGRFDDGQIQQLATRYDYVVMDRAHGGANVLRQLDDARRIKRVDPTTRVLLYVNAAFWYDTNSEPGGWGAPYDPRWSLTDPATGGPLRFRGTTTREIATFVDLGDAAYRAQLLALLRSWLGRAPLDGIAFDTVQPATPGRAVLGRADLTWADVLPGPRLPRYNDGLVALLRDTKALVGPEGEVLVNGIADTELATNRNLQLVDDADVVVDEEFCLDNRVRHDPAKLRADLDLMEQLARRGTRVLEKTNTRDAVGGAELLRLGRFCSGAFLLGWQPGSSYFKFGPGYTEAELTSTPVEWGARLGRPLGAYREDGGIARRDFEHGSVLVNLGGRAVDVRARIPGSVVTPAAPVPRDADDPIAVGPQDAVVIVRRPD